jgi:hypothetical protein
LTGKVSILAGEFEALQITIKICLVGIGLPSEPEMMSMLGDKANQYCLNHPGLVLKFVRLDYEVDRVEQSTTLVGSYAILEKPDDFNP